MYTKTTQSNIKSQHVHTLIVARPSIDDELDTVMRCTSCHRIMLMEHVENGGGTISSHQCPPKLRELLEQVVVWLTTHTN